jgi:uncharacterized membrane-anchored protein YhcB (DUF1043 family)
MEYLVGGIIGMFIGLTIGLLVMRLKEVPESKNSLDIDFTSLKSREILQRYFGE